ncbi:hypothetical protein WEI85_39725 [Actinomycetes bacterium KLBMP 9797]
MADPRARYFRQLRKLRRSARRWSVMASGLAGAAVVLTPYAGLGVADAAWAAAAGGSLALAGWRWADLRALAAQPAPPPPDPALAGEQARAKLVAAVQRLPIGRTALDEVRRQQARFALRGSAAASPWIRLDRASATLAGLAGRITGPGEPAVLEAAVAERSLRDLAHRVAGVEKALRFAPADARAALEDGRTTLMTQLETGVTAYERLVAAAASYVAEDGRASVEDPAVTRLTEAGDMLHGIALGLAELRERPLSS